jgi:hypothetical protein
MALTFMAKGCVKPLSIRPLSLRNPATITEVSGAKSYSVATSQEDAEGKYFSLQAPQRASV